MARGRNRRREKREEVERKHRALASSEAVEPDQGAADKPSNDHQAPADDAQIAKADQGGLTKKRAAWTGLFALLGTIGGFTAIGGFIHSAFFYLSITLVAASLISIAHQAKTWFDDAYGRQRVFWILQILVVLIILGLAAHFSVRNYQKASEQLDVLVPGNEPMPPLPLGESYTNYPSDFVFVFLGNLVLSFKPAEIFPVVRYFDVDYLKITTNRHGALISGEFLSGDGRVIAEIEDNRFILGNEAYKPKTPDRHTFIVSDQYNNEVLNLRYLNPRAFYLTGLLRLPQGIEIAIRTNGIMVKQGRDEFWQSEMVQSGGSVGLQFGSNAPP